MIKLKPGNKRTKHYLFKIYLCQLLFHLRSSTKIFFIAIMEAYKKITKNKINCEDTDMKLLKLLYFVTLHLTLKMTQFL